MNNESIAKLVTYNLENITVIEIEGNIQQTESEELEEILHLFYEEKKVNIVIDMKKVSNICSSALGLMVNYKKLLNENGGDLKMVINSPQVFELFKITMMDKVFDTLDNIQEAENAF
ncbi:MAG: STAS domain-containing protein [Spirochaetia bacterium]|nr:STAS domain-containing protein [Spirochaetia bacterium]